VARKLYYKILNDGTNHVTDGEWEEILRLQNWYNSEFSWSAGRIAFKMYAVFPNVEAQIISREELRTVVLKRMAELKLQGLTENQIILQLEREGLVTAKQGGYFDDCVASGFTRVAGNEFNAYLVCDFLVKASRIAAHAVITLYDEGEFVKPKNVKIADGAVILTLTEQARKQSYELMIENRHVFAVVDSAKYDGFPRFQSTVSDFNDLPFDERQEIIRDWNWLGFENNFDINGDDIQGFDLNRKVNGFRLENLVENA
jgi:hypothetical protein